MTHKQTKMRKRLRLARTVRVWDMLLRFLRKDELSGRARAVLKIEVLRKIPKLFQAGGEVPSIIAQLIFIIFIILCIINMAILIFY